MVAPPSLDLSHSANNEGSENNRQPVFRSFRGSIFKFNILSVKNCEDLIKCIETDTTFYVYEKKNEIYLIPYFAKLSIRTLLYIQMNLIF